MFLSLPNELKLQIVSELESALDTFNLARTCRTMWVVIDEKTIVKKDIAYQRVLVKQGWRAIAQQDNVPQPLVHLAIKGNVATERIEMMLDLFRDEFPNFLVSPQKLPWVSPLSVAIEHDRIDVVKLCLRKGTDISTDWVRYDHWRDFDPLHLALTLRRGSIAWLLVDEGAAVSHLMMYLAASGHFPKIVERIMSRLKAEGSFDESLLRIAIYSAVMEGNFEPKHAQREDVNSEVINILLREYSALPGERLKMDDMIMGCMYRAFSLRRNANLLHLWDIYARDHLRPGVAFRDTARYFARGDVGLEIIKELRVTYPRAVIDKETEEWTAGEELLLFAMGKYGEEDENPCSPRKNYKTIQYLLDAGCRFSAAHLERAALVDDVEMIDRIVESGVSANQYSVEYPEYTLLERALNQGRWYASFRLIHHGAIWIRSFPAIALPLRSKAARAFAPVDYEGKFDWPRKERFRSQGELSEFVVGMSSQTQPDKTVFAMGRTRGSFKTQLFTLFQLVLGVDFLDKPRSQPTGQDVLSA